MNVSKSVCILGDEKEFERCYRKKDNLENKNTLFVTFENDFEALLESGKKRL